MDKNSKKEHSSSNKTNLILITTIDQHSNHLTQLNNFSSSINSNNNFSKMTNSFKINQRESNQLAIPFMVNSRMLYFRDSTLLQMVTNKEANRDLGQLAIPKLCNFNKEAITIIITKTNLEIITIKMEIRTTQSKSANSNFKRAKLTFCKIIEEKNKEL